MPRILFVNGSPRAGGNTSRILKVLGEEITAAFAAIGQAPEIETVDLCRRDVRFCRGCRICFDKGEDRCPLKDDIPGIAARMIDSDIVVLASPVFVDDVSGLMKTFLDRNAWMNHRPALWGRLAAVLTTVGSARSWRAAGVLSSALRAWGAVVAGSDWLITGATMDPSWEETFRPRLRSLAARLAEALRTKRQEHPGLAELIYFLVMREAWRRNPPDDSLDYRWWKDQGLLDTNRIWPRECRTRAPIRGLARGLAALTAAILLR